MFHPPHTSNPFLWPLWHSLATYMYMYQCCQFTCCFVSTQCTAKQLIHVSFPKTLECFRISRWYISSFFHREHDLTQRVLAKPQQILLQAAQLSENSENTLMRTTCDMQQNIVGLQYKLTVISTPAGTTIDLKESE